MDKYNIGLNRRHFLRTSTTAIGLGSVTVGTAKSKEQTDLGSIHFVEAGIKYQMDTPSNDTHIIPTNEDDEILGYSVDMKEKRLDLNWFTTPDLKSTFQQRSEVVRAKNYRPLPARRLKIGSPYSLPIRLTENYRSVQSLSVAQEYQHPTVNITTQDKDVDVSINGNNASIPSEQEKTIPLPERTVQVIAEQKVNKDVSGIPSEKQADTFWEDFSKPIEVKPIVKVRNRGMLTVFDLE